MISKRFLVLVVPVLDAGACGGVSRHVNFVKALPLLIAISFENASEKELRRVCWPIEIRWRSAGAPWLRARNIDGSPFRAFCSRSMILPSGAITCLYVAKGNRQQGLTGRLIEAGCELAASFGASVVEAYPRISPDKPSNPLALYTGTEGSFTRAGFNVVAKPTPVRRIMRKPSRNESCHYCFFLSRFPLRVFRQNKKSAALGRRSIP
jgi:GNAT superfamily N-acetyltransferase